MLGKAGIKSLDDLADLAGDELQEIIGEDDLSIDEANAVIMAARAHWFEDGSEEEGVEQENIDEPGNKTCTGKPEEESSGDSESVLASGSDGDDASVVEPEPEDGNGAVD